MKVKIHYDGRYNYATIDTGKLTVDVRLEHGRSASQSLRESAGELRQKAAGCILRASLLEEAAIHLDT